MITRHEAFQKAVLTARDAMEARNNGDFADAQALGEIAQAWALIAAAAPKVNDYDPTGGKTDPVSGKTVAWGQIGNDSAGV